MKRVKNTSDSRLASVKWNLLLSGFVFWVFLICLFIMHSTVRENAKRTGSEITYNYSRVDESNMQIYRTWLVLGEEYLTMMSNRGATETEMELWLQTYLENTQASVENLEVSTYAYYNDKIISAKKWEMDDSYDVTQREWYQKALNAEGAIIFTDVYEDAIYGKPVITIAKQCGEAVLAIDIYTENFQQKDNTQELPEGSFYYICDRKGTLLHKKCGPGANEEIAEENFVKLYEKIKQWDSEKTEGHFYDSDGERMEIYYRKAANGWHFILVIPYDYLNQDWQMIVRIYLVALVIAMAVILIMWIRANAGSKEIKKINETVQILGTSYFAYYKINISKETYEMIRGSEYVKGRLQSVGKYTDLLAVFKEIIIEDEYMDFYESFSLENIRRQIKNNVRDFGGDFRRYFDGKYKWVSVRMLFSPSLNNEEVVLCFRLVEDEKQWQLKRMELLEDALKAANASENSQKQFFSNISHDMRTPLNVIIGMSELAGKCMDEPERVQSYLEKINYSSRQLLSLINDILEMSRLERGIILEKENFNIRERMDACINAFRANAKNEQKEIEVRYNIQHEVVEGDVFRLEQIVNNLMSNALKFTKEGDCVAFSVREIESQEHAKYQIVVQDTGIGMSAEFLKHIFEPYEREKRFGNREIEGTGLGMPIVKNLVSLMGGDITVQSELNLGSMFMVTLPFEVVVEAEVTDRKEKSEFLEEKKPEMILAGRTILIAEDYELNMELTTDILQMNGAKVLQAWNGQESVEIFEQSEVFSIDAILMDMRMPVMDGCQATRVIRQSEREDNQIPIIALTANAFSEDIARTVEAGMNAHICKPLDINVLCDTLQKWMRESTDAKYDINSR